MTAWTPARISVLRRIRQGGVTEDNRRAHGVHGTTLRALGRLRLYEVAEGGALRLTEQGEDFMDSVYDCQHCGKSFAYLTIAATATGRGVALGEVVEDFEDRGCYALDPRTANACNR